MTRNPVGDNEAFSAVYWSAMANAHDFEGILSGCDPTKGTGNNEIDAAAGETIHGSAADPVTFAADTVDLGAADGSNNRVDLVTISSAGVLTGTNGTAAADPLAPDIPSGHALLAAVHRVAAESSIASANIHDYRIILGSQIDYTERQSLAFDAVYGRL